MSQEVVSQEVWAAMAARFAAAVEDERLMLELRELRIPIGPGHCADAIGVHRGCAHDVPIRSTPIDSVSRETVAFFSAAGGAGHPALSRIPLPVVPEGDGL